MEHGRWNVERLLRGWALRGSQGRQREIVALLGAMGELPRDIQKYDADAIRSLPASFREAGLEVYRLQESAGEARPISA